MYAKNIKYKKVFKGPKYVRKAGCWCVTIFEGKRQAQYWLNTKKDAEEFIKRGGDGK